MSTKPGFFVYCRELGREENKSRIGTAIMLGVGGSREHDTLYLMIPMNVERAKKLRRVIFITSEEREEIEIDRYEQNES